MTSGWPGPQRATTVKGISGSRPSCSATSRRSVAVTALLPLVLDRPLVVDLALLGLAHEPLQHLLEAGIASGAAVDTGCRVLERLDGQVDLPVLFDGDDLRLDPIVEMKVVLDVPDVVPVDLRDVDQTEPAVFQLEERTEGRDALDGTV